MRPPEPEVPIRIDLAIVANKSQVPGHEREPCTHEPRLVAALLRDLVNWCIENPLEGKQLDDDPRMKALKAYILSQRVRREDGTGKALIN